MSRKTCCAIEVFAAAEAPALVAGGQRERGRRGDDEISPIDQRVLERPQLYVSEPGFVALAVGPGPPAEGNERLHSEVEALVRPAELDVRAIAPAILQGFEAPQKGQVQPLLVFDMRVVQRQRLDDRAGERRSFFVRGERDNVLHLSHGFLSSKYDERIPPCPSRDARNGSRASGARRRRARKEFEPRRTRQRKRHEICRVGAGCSDGRCGPRARQPAAEQVKAEAGSLGLPGGRSGRLGTLRLALEVRERMEPHRVLRAEQRGRNEAANKRAMRRAVYRQNA